MRFCANLVNLRPRSGIGYGNTRADQRISAGLDSVTLGSEYLLTVSLPTSRRVTVAVLVLLGCCALAGPVVPAPVYWTRARMAAAARAGAGTRASGLPWAGGGAVARTTGRVFFTLNNVQYSCSGSAVASKNQDVVMTAAHCVSDGAGHWATHWTFVPGYTDGHEPYAQRLQAPRCA